MAIIRTTYHTLITILCSTVTALSGLAIAGHATHNEFLAAWFYDKPPMALSSAICLFIISSCVATISVLITRIEAVYEIKLHYRDVRDARLPGDPRDERDARFPGDPRDSRDERWQGDPRDTKDERII